jgi:hypothetical protein
MVAYLNNYVTTNALFLQTAFLQNLVFSSDLWNTTTSTGGSGSGRFIVGISSTYTFEPFNFNLDFQSDINGNPDYGTQLPLKLGWMLGYRQGFYENNSTYVSEGIVDLTGPKYMYLIFNDFNNNVNINFYGAFNSSLLSRNILALITNPKPQLNGPETNAPTVTSATRQYFGPVDIQKIFIQLVDEYGRIVDLNNMDFSFLLEFQINYDAI